LVDFQNNSSSGPAGQKTIVDCGILFDDTQIVQRLDWYTKMGNIMEFFRDLTSKHHIEVLGIEKLYFTSKNQSNAEFVYGIRSSLILHFLAQGTKLIEIDPVQVKKYIS
jgi:Holliday junction resolvasome RuvABC endonuclease subunit